LFDHTNFIFIHTEE